MFNQLPKEIIDVITQFISPMDLNVLRLCSKRFHGMKSSWKNKIFEELKTHDSIVLFDVVIANLQPVMHLTLTNFVIDDDAFKIICKWLGKRKVKLHVTEEFLIRRYQGVSMTFAKSIKIKTKNSFRDGKISGTVITNRLIFRSKHKVKFCKLEDINAKDVVFYWESGLNYLFTKFKNMRDVVRHSWPDDITPDAIIVSPNVLIEHKASIVRVLTSNSKLKVLITRDEPNVMTRSQYLTDKPWVWPDAIPMIKELEAEKWDPKTRR